MSKLSKAYIPNRLFCFLVMFWALVRPVDAALLSVDLSQRGDHLITRDTATGLEWLDLSVTAGMTKNDLTVGLTSNNELLGWRFANITEWKELLKNAGVAGYTNGLYSSSNYEAVSRLMDLVGVLYITVGDNNATQGLLLDQYGTCCSRRTYLEIRHDQGDVARIIDNWSWTVWQSSPSIGSYLVRLTPTPLPSTFFLFIFGLGSLRLLCWRRG